jgi:predicted GNAT family N-acyltransferase
LEIQRVDANTVRPLRREILRPARPPEASIYDEDDDPQTVHLAAYNSDGSLVGCVTLFPEEYDAEPLAWRLRGMATISDVRGTGVGGALLAASVDVVTKANAPLLWCNARESAEGFYARYGFVGVGEIFELPLAGPHRRMVLRLSPAGRD